jgi:hypothetical protein
MSYLKTEVSLIGTRKVVSKIVKGTEDERSGNEPDGHLMVGWTRHMVTSA